MPFYYVGNIPISDELYHHGIIGQKWGVRRYQNPDGTLTAAGKERYSKNPAFVYRDKYGNETEYGRKRSTEFNKRLDEIYEKKKSRERFYKRGRFC